MCSYAIIEMSRSAARSNGKLDPIAPAKGEDREGVKPVFDRQARFSVDSLNRSNLPPRDL